MATNKRTKDFQKIEEFKLRFYNYETEYLKKRLTSNLIKEAAIAIREILEERNEMNK